MSDSNQSAETLAYESEGDQRRYLRTQTLEGKVEFLIDGMFSMIRNGHAIRSTLGDHGTQLHNLNNVDKKLNEKMMLHEQQHHEHKLEQEASSKVIQDIFLWGRRGTIALAFMILVLGGPHEMAHYWDLIHSYW